MSDQPPRLTQDDFDEALGLVEGQGKPSLSFQGYGKRPEIGPWNSTADKVISSLSQVEIDGLAAGTHVVVPIKSASVLAEIREIMRVYDEQYARNKGYVDTPGGLEHMGDVWKQLAEWRAMIEERNGP